MVKIEKDVAKKIHEVAAHVGRYLGDDFDIECCNRIWDSGMASPIEQLFLAGFRGACILSGEQEPADVYEMCGKAHWRGVGIHPQKEIGPYRVDFFLESGHRSDDGKEEIKSVIVECDSQEFHERTEPQRRYEKKRGRYFTSAGYKIFHFTGKEIKDDPLNVGFEVLSFLTGRQREELESGLD